MTETLTRSISVLIVDDHAVTRRGLAVAIESFDDLLLAGMAESGEQALHYCRTAQPDIVLVDLVMPGMDGAAVTRAIADGWPDMRVIALTAFTEPHLVQEALGAGAAHCLLKDVSAEELAEAIRMTYSGQWEPSPATQSRLNFAQHLRPGLSPASQRTAGCPPDLDGAGRPGHELNGTDSTVLN